MRVTKAVSAPVARNAFTGDRFEFLSADVLAFPGTVPHSYRKPDVAKEARGVSVVVLVKAGDQGMYSMNSVSFRFRSLSQIPNSTRLGT